MIQVIENEKTIKVSLNIKMSKKEIQRIQDKMSAIKEPEGEYDITELISKSAGISLKKAEDFLTIMQLMQQRQMMEDAEEQEEIDENCKEIFGI